VVRTIKKYTLESFSECTGVGNVVEVGRKSVPGVQSSHFACVTRGRGPALFGGVGIRYVLALPVLQITSCLHVRREKTCTQSDSDGDRTDFTPRRIIRLTQ